MQNKLIQKLVSGDSRKYLLTGTAALAVSLVVFSLWPSSNHKAIDHHVSASAVNQVENSGQTVDSSTDGYAINGQNSVPAVTAAASAVGSSALQPAGATASIASASTLGTGALKPAGAPLGVTGQLSSINAQLQSIQATLTGDNSPTSKQLKAEIYSVEYAVKDLISMSENNITQQIQSSSQTLQTELSGMKGQLTNIQQLSQPGSYIDPSNLPFTLQFIDSVSGQNVVTVSYNNLLTPLSVGEALAGWTLINADYGSQFAVFQNAKDQLVKVGTNNAAVAGQGE